MSLQSWINKFREEGKTPSVGTRQNSWLHTKKQNIISWYGNLKTGFTLKHLHVHQSKVHRVSDKFIFYFKMLIYVEHLVDFVDTWYWVINPIGEREKTRPGRDFPFLYIHFRNHARINSQTNITLFIPSIVAKRRVAIQFTSENENAAKAKME